MTDFSPREIVSELDCFIVGQGDAKAIVKKSRDICAYTNRNITVEALNAG